MIDRLTHFLRRLTVGDYLIGFALALMLLTLVNPTLKARDFRRNLDATATEVDAMRQGAEGVRAATGSWPAPLGPGSLPPELSGVFQSDTSLVREEYTLQWQRWEVVDSVEAPPTPVVPSVDAPPDSVGPEMMPVVRNVAGIVLYSPDSDLLAGLLERYGAGASFVRDTTWTLLLSGAGGGL